MTTDQWITIAAIVIGPVAAVCISLWFQRRASGKDAKARSFFMLMAHRKDPLHQDRILTLNTIDVVWGDHKSILQLWHEYYTILMQSPETSLEQWNHAHIRLLHEMALALGYKNIEQVDIDKFYSPKGVAQQVLTNYELQQEFIRVLKSTADLNVTPQEEGG